MAKDLLAVRKQYPTRKNIGRVLVFQKVKRSGLSMHQIERLLSKKGGRVFPGKKKELSHFAKAANKEKAELRALGNEYFVELSQNTCCRTSRKANYC